MLKATVGRWVLREGLPPAIGINDVSLFWPPEKASAEQKV